MAIAVTVSHQPGSFWSQLLTYLQPDVHSVSHDVRIDFLQDAARPTVGFAVCGLLLFIVFLGVGTGLYDSHGGCSGAR